MPSYSPNDVAKKGIALLRAKHYYILYDAKGMLGILSPEPSKPSFQTLAQMPYFIYAVITVSRKDKTQGWGASQVTTSASQPGYGPLLYDIVMAFEDGLFPDRDDVSHSARKVWKFYKDNRHDVSAKFLDNINKPKTPTRFDDALVYNGGEKNPLNYAYFIDKMPNVSQLLINNDVALEKLAEYGISEFNLLRFADQFFLDRYDQANT